MKLGILLLALAAPVFAQTGKISGIVTNGRAAEAGVWVIAETEDLPTRFAKIVVTDERGKFLIPELPKASYRVWVRGYGLVDSKKVKARLGDRLRLKAAIAPNEGSAAQYYPSIYWYSMLGIPDKAEFPIGKAANQPEWLNVVKTNGCVGCHALGTAATRTVPKALGHFKSSEEAWARRITSGQAMTQMVNALARNDTERMLKQFAEWTDRVAMGEVPAAKPPRPQGVERNVVITLWDWSNEKAYLHDEVSTDRRNPTVNAYGKLYGATEESTDLIPVLDPKAHTATEIRHPVRDPETPSSKELPMAPSPYWGREPIWDSHTTTHNPMLDEQGRVWFTARVRSPRNPEFCRKGHPSAQVFPLESANRHLSMYDPKSGQFTLISTCFTTHHLAFAEDANQTLWTSAGGPQNPVLGWLDRKVFQETGDEQKAQGWTPFVLDSNGNGKRDESDERVVTGLYSVAVNPKDGSIWGTSLGFPGRVVRVDPGPDPTHTALTEIYEPPLPGYGPRGGDIDRDGAMWVSLASGHLGRFERSKCKGPLNGPAATGQHCPEGWTLYPVPGPQFKGVTETGSAEASYYTWVDQFDTFGLGRNVPIATGNLNEGLLALVDGKFVTLRVPYPLGYYTKWLDGRIDDAKAGWKGRGLWSTVSTRAPFHMEGGKGTRPKVVRFQLRPNPTSE
ncbi:MAG TPA: hypothetical protein VNU64_00035 [Burkholderiales bacterium]|nr:hypothetical protein [Burkholderiales bacterium]